MIKLKAFSSTGGSDRCDGEIRTSGPRLNQTLYQDLADALPHLQKIRGSQPR